jgi:hypothetical protein
MKLSLPDISHKSIPAIVAALLLALVYCGGVWYVKRLERTVEAQASELSLELTREASMRSLAGFLEELKPDAQRLSSFFVAPDDAVATIERVEGLGDLAGAPVSIGGVRIEGEDPETREGSMITDVAAAGTWREIMRLLALIDTLPFASALENVSLTSGGVAGEDSERQWSLRGTLRVTLRR